MSSRNGVGETKRRGQIDQGRNQEVQPGRAGSLERASGETQRCRGSKCFQSDMLKLKTNLAGIAGVQTQPLSCRFAYPSLPLIASRAKTYSGGFHS